MITIHVGSADASRDTPPRVISKARSKLERTRYGKDCVFFSFAQVGQDRGATRYLSDLDEDPYIGGSIDVSICRNQTFQSF